LRAHCSINGLDSASALPLRRALSPRAARAKPPYVLNLDNSHLFLLLLCACTLLHRAPHVTWLDDKGPLERDATRS